MDTNSTILDPSDSTDQVADKGHRNPAPAPEGAAGWGRPVAAGVQDATPNPLAAGLFAPDVAMPPPAGAPSPTATLPRSPAAAHRGPASGDPAAAVEVEDLFAAPSMTGMRHGGPAPVVFVLAAKGGVGKTTTAVLLAERAAARGVRTTLVDMNRGQADVSTVLRLGRAGLATAYDAVANPAERVLLTPEQTGPVRPAGLQELGYAVVLAPPRTLADAETVTASVYRRILEAARTRSELVVVDTQTVDAHDTGGLVDLVVVPYLGTGAWGLVVSGFSNTSLENTQPVVLDLLAHGASSTRILSCLNAVPDPERGSSAAAVGRFFGRFSTYLGDVGHDPRLAGQMNHGVTDQIPAAMAALCDDALHRVLGLEPDPPPAEPPARSRLLARLFGGRR